jgi:hypothetical protein
MLPRIPKTGLQTVTLPPNIDWALREIGVVPAKVPPQPVERQFKGIWYRDGDIPH